MTLSNTFGSTWLIGESAPSRPAFATSTSSLPYRSLRVSPSRSMPSESVRSSGTSVAEPPACLMASSSSSSPPTVRAIATTCAPAFASASAVAWPMPRDAPVTSAMRSARGFIRPHPEGRCEAPRLEGWPNTMVLRDAALRAAPQHEGLQRSTRLGKQRQLPRRVVAPALVGERRRIIAGEAVIGKLRPLRIALLVAHGAIDAIDGQERERIRTDDAAHFFQRMRRGEQL